MKNEIWHGDCLKLMKNIPDNSIDMILCDLPFGTTYQKWDTVIDIKQMWVEYLRITKFNSAIVLHASQPFTTLLCASNLEMFKYCWVWDKTNPTNFPNAKKQPLKQHEDICVFYKEQCKYHPIMVPGIPNHKQGSSKTNYSETRLIKNRVNDDLTGMKYPKSILNFPKHSSQCKLHPNQKPIDLLEYLIKTYSDEEDLILDNSAGSGSTLLAAKNLKRNYIGIEKDEKYFNITSNRLK